MNSSRVPFVWTHPTKSQSGGRLIKEIKERERSYRMIQEQDNYTESNTIHGGLKKEVIHMCNLKSRNPVKALENSMK